jgi:hypothetical protein
MKSADQAKKVIVEIMRQAGGELVGKTRLFMAFYLAHLFYAESAPGYLTDWPVVRMPNGPGIDAGEELLLELTLAGLVTRDHVPEGPFRAVKYRLTDQGKSLPPLGRDETTAIRAAVDYVKAHTATQLSDITHEFSRSWAEARDGQALNIYIDLIPEDEYESRQKRLDALRDEIMAAWR